MSAQPKRRAGDISSSLIEQIVATRPRSSLLVDTEKVAFFLRRYFANVSVEDMQDKSAHTLGKAAVSHVEFAGTRKPGEVKLRIYNPTAKQDGYDSRYTIIEMVNDNMPFLVDSVSAAINRQNLAVHMTIHPVLRVRRDQQGKLLEVIDRSAGDGHVESYVRFAVDREPDRQLLNILEHEIHKVLADVRATVRDWKDMRGKMLEASAALKDAVPGADPELRDESEALLHWMADDRFTFIGYREYRVVRRSGRVFLRPVPSSGLGVLTRDERGGRAFELSKEMQRLTRSRDWLIITKANSRSTVHRHSYLDYVGVKIFDGKGNAVGEKRFLGLFTSVAYSESPRNIPLLRLKVKRVIDRSQLDVSGHRGKALLHVLESFPRDELLQSSVQDLVRTTNGILNLQDRRRVKFFVRRDPFRRFFSCIVYVPREKYTTGVRRRIEEILLRAFVGISVDSSVQIAESPLARAHIIVRTGVPDRPRISIREIEQKIADAVVTWRDKLRDELTERFGEQEGHALFREYGESFSMAYE
ncbi:MAG: NAD-glutamate dehydrogenase, partial [Woeseiaceae bacterium]